MAVTWPLVAVAVVAARVIEGAKEAGRLRLATSIVVAVRLVEARWKMIAVAVRLVEARWKLIAVAVVARPVVALVALMEEEAKLEVTSVHVTVTV